MDEGDSVQFRRRLLMVAEGLGREDVEGLKFLCKDLIPFGKLEAMTSARDVFQFLISSDIVNPEDTFVIAELLYRIKHNYLLQKINYTKEMVQGNLRLKGQVSEFRQMLYELSEEFTEDDLGTAVFLLREHLPKRQPKMSGVELLTALERNDLLSENNLQLLEELCGKISPNLLTRIDTYKLKRVSLSVQESKENAPSSVRESPLGGACLSAAIQERSIKYPPDSLDSYSSLREHTGHVHSFGSNPGVKAENSVGHSEQSFPLREQDDESKIASKRYKMDGPCRGHCLIFNNVNFEGHLGRRMGSQKDAEELEHVFKWLGLEVVMYDDQTSIEIHEHLQKWQSSENWKDSDCLVCCILSHGKSGEIYGTDAQLIPIRTIMSYFTAHQCPLLARKPKLFFIQACQGEKTQKAVYLEVDTDDHLGADAQSAGSSSPQPSIPEEADFLLGMATVDGYLSFRHTREGTWYIQALCTKLQQLVPRGEDILSILTEVNKDVSYRADPKGLKKQMPQPAFTLRKKLIFPVPEAPPPSQQP
ncbi:PREDICTED: caspase-10-like [Gekko japonicus]|uniref:Caspase-10-like n=1 Tax=Gekko japonicus TaxID=146911 RepID=A0ABM1L4W6_GEKJA|nr:PREDICTED: caspase-10-like [Gekko japonicus]